MQTNNSSGALDQFFVSFLFSVLISRTLDNITEWSVYVLEKGLIIDLYMFWSYHRVCVGPKNNL